MVFVKYLSGSRKKSEVIYQWRFSLLATVSGFWRSKKWEARRGGVIPG